jgi:hypothetical protein
MILGVRSQDCLSPMCRQIPPRYKYVFIFFIFYFLVSPYILQKAWQHINTLKANFGGTDIHMPMKALYLRAFLSQSPTNIFLFTGKYFFIIPIFICFNYCLSNRRPRKSTRIFVGSYSSQRYTCASLPLRYWSKSFKVTLLSFLLLSLSLFFVFHFHF